MHYVQKNLNKEELELTFELWIFFTSQQCLAPSWQHVGCQFLCQAPGRGSKVMLVFLEEKLKHQLHILVLFANLGSDSKLSHLDQQTEKTGHSDFSKINIFA